MVKNNFNFFKEETCVAFNKKLSSLVNPNSPHSPPPDKMLFSPGRKRRKMKKSLSPRRQMPVAKSTQNLPLQDSRMRPPGPPPSTSNIRPISPPRTMREREREIMRQSKEMRSRSRTKSKENYMQGHRYPESKPYVRESHAGFDYTKRRRSSVSSPGLPLKEKPQNYNKFRPKGEDVGSLKREIEMLRQEKQMREKEFFKTNQEMKQIKDSLRVNQDFLLALKKDMATVQAYPHQNKKDEEYRLSNRNYY